jgi:hypothetical protein
VGVGVGVSSGEECTLPMENIKGRHSRKRLIVKALATSGEDEDMEPEATEKEKRKNQDGSPPPMLMARLSPYLEFHSVTNC